MEMENIGKKDPQFEVYLGKTLLGNWVEERNVAHIDNAPKTIKEVHIGGHEGILTTTEKTDDTANKYRSTSVDSYKKPNQVTKQQIGKREEVLVKKLYEKFSAEVDDQMNQPPDPIEFTSTTKKDFARDYTPDKIKSVMEHDVNTESPVTYWSENINKIHGVTQLPCERVPFRKNASFSTPIAEHKDSPKPHEEWNF